MGYSSSSSSESEVEDFSVVLKSVGLRRKYGRLFEKAGFEDVDDAKSLTESKLKKLGVTSSSDRRKIIRAIEKATESDSDSSSSSSDYDSDSSSSSESEDDMSEVERKLERNGLRKYFRYLRKGKVTTLKSAGKLSESKLKSLGIESSRTRTKILSVFVKSSKARSGKKRRNSGSTHSSISCSSNSDSSRRSGKSKSSEKDIILQALRSVSLETLGIKLFEHDVTTLKAASKLGAEELKEFGLSTFSVRSRILCAFRKESLEQAAKDLKSKSKKNLKNESDSDEESNDPIYKALKRVHMQKHFKLFVKSKITNVRQAQELGHDQLLDIGIKNCGQRELVMEGLAEADWQCAYCNTWNEHRKTCVVCQKTHRIRKGSNSAEETNAFELNQKVKYTGRSRPDLKISNGAKGEIHRVLENGQFYMVNFQQKDKILKIRLKKSELAAVKIRGRKGRK